MKTGEKEQRRAAQQYRASEKQRKEGHPRQSTEHEHLRAVGDRCRSEPQSPLTQPPGREEAGTGDWIANKRAALVSSCSFS